MRYAWRRPGPWLSSSVCWLPLLVQLIALEMFPSRYAFPHFWPCFVVIAVALRGAWSRRCSRHVRFRRLIVVAATMVILFPCSDRRFRQVLYPRRFLASSDAKEFLSGGPFSGFGIDSAVQYLHGRTSGDGMVVLIDPIWGTPADVIFTYLNNKDGIRVCEAWWLRISKTTRFCPKAR